MNRNQKIAVGLSVILLGVVGTSVYFIYKSEQEEEDYYPNKYPSHYQNDEVTVDTTSYNPIEEEVNTDEEKNDEVFTVVEQMPEFPGGEDEMNKFLDANLKYPTMAKEQGIQGKVWIGFIVDKSGKIRDVEVIRGIGGGCDEEAARVIKKMPNWKPGKQGGNPVIVEFRFPINFTLR